MAQVRFSPNTDSVLIREEDFEYPECERTYF